MSQEMKLLMALTEALGFEVETTLDYQERKTHTPVGLECGRVCESDGQGYIRDEHGVYTSRLAAPIVDYKLTKRADILKGQAL